MGGGTGTGASHVIAKAAREMNILTVGVTTLPFSYEGPKRMRRAVVGLEELKRHLDTTIVVPNQNLFKIANETTGFEESFSLSNDVLKHGVQSITDLMVRPGMINLDFADVETVMSSSGKAMMGTGEAEGENRAMAATELALNNPLIDEYTLQGAKGLLVNITGGSDIKLFEVDAAVNKIRAEVDPEAELIFGAIKDENMNGKIRVSIVATSLKGSNASPELKPILNVVNGSNRISNNFSENLFSRNNLEQNFVNSIDGATALKLDENYEIKNNEEQNSLIDKFERIEENQIAQETSNNQISEEIPAGVSIESAAYMESSSDLNDISINNLKSETEEEKIQEEYTPKLFSEDQNHLEDHNEEIREHKEDDQLFDQDTNEEEEDFEIPAFLRRQKF